MLKTKNQPPAPIIYSGLNVGTSQFDLPVPIFWGTRRLSTNAIWFNHFSKSPANGKGKGGGGKSNQQSYDYKAAVILALCEGPVDEITLIWANGSTTTTTTLSALNMVFAAGTITEGVWSYVETNYPSQAIAYRLTALVACPTLDLGESATIPDNDFECLRLSGVSFAVGASPTLTFIPWASGQTPNDYGLYVGRTLKMLNGAGVGETATVSAASASGLTLASALGTVPAAGDAFSLAFAYTWYQPNGGWINPNSHNQAGCYDCLMSDIITDLLTNPQYGLGFTSADLGDMTQFAAYQRAQGLFFSPLLNQLEKATSIIDRWAQLSNAWIYWSGAQLQFYPLADEALSQNGVVFTPQNDVAYHLGLADFIAETGADTGPVKVTRIDPADAYNRTVLNITDRTQGYISNPVEWKDQYLVDRFGLRDNANVQADEICDPNVGKIVVQLLGKRAAYIRNTYEFRTSYRYICCLPGTVLTLTEPNIGLNQVRVRVTRISEDEAGVLSFTCEEFPGTAATYAPPVNAGLAAGAAWTTSSTILYLAASAPSWLTALLLDDATVAVNDLTTGQFVGYVAGISGTAVTLEAPALSASAGASDSLAFTAQALATTPNQYVAPGAVNTPAIVEPGSAFTGATPKIIIAASGGTNWGGCTVNVSFDGVSYSQVGTITSAARQGVLTAALASFSGTNPDTTHTLAVDCTESEGLPASVTNADAAALRTLSLVAAQPTLSAGAYVMPTNGELLAFGAVTATGTYAADLTYLYRGAYGTSAGAHNIGDQFTLLDVSGTDGTSVTFDLPPQYIGQTIYLKFASFNLFGLSQQDLSTCAEYQYTPTGAGYGTGSGGVPATPTGLNTSTGAANVVTISWNANAASDNVTSYVLYRAAGAGASFSSATKIWSGDALSTTDANVTSLYYTYFLVAVNAAGSSSPTSGSVSAPDGALDFSLSGNPLIAVI